MRASCLCGGITIEIGGPIYSPRYCHCTNCRKFSGTAFAAWGVVDAATFEVKHAVSEIARFDSGGGHRAFCGTCGTPLFYEPKGRPQLRGIPLGIIDDGEVPAPSMHVWTQSKVAWTSVEDGLPRYDTHP